MLNLIGIQVYSLTAEFAIGNISLFILNNLQELNSTIYAENNHHCCIVYLNNIISNEENKMVEEFLVKYPQYIIITNIELTISKKHFYISMHQNNRYYEKIQKYILRCGTTYGIQKLTIC